ncbi:hypothetical protein [Aeromonas hydrophila]|uniref:hypothetical protein n=1 Tax=Aeromonas hydrophila TaxID=644 RepID=UPI00126A24F5|nr:hypothetical protein [Aeromonas hydrophila]
MKFKLLYLCAVLISSSVRALTCPPIPQNCHVSSPEFDANTITLYKDLSSRTENGRIGQFAISLRYSCRTTASQDRKIIIALDTSTSKSLLSSAENKFVTWDSNITGITITSHDLTAHPKIGGISGRQAMAYIEQNKNGCVSGKAKRLFYIHKGPQFNHIAGNKEFNFMTPPNVSILHRSNNPTPHDKHTSHTLNNTSVTISEVPCSIINLDNNIDLGYISMRGINSKETYKTARIYFDCPKNQKAAYYFHAPGGYNDQQNGLIKNASKHNSASGIALLVESKLDSDDAFRPIVFDHTYVASHNNLSHQSTIIKVTPVLIERNIGPGKIEADVVITMVVP